MNEEQPKAVSNEKKYDLLLRKIEEAETHEERVGYIKLLDQSVAYEAEFLDSETIYSDKVEGIKKHYDGERENIKIEKEPGYIDELLKHDLMEWLEIYAEIKKLLWRTGYYLGDKWQEI